MTRAGDAIRAGFHGLVDRCGGVEAAASIVSARMGATVHKGTISRYQNAGASIPIEAVVALEDILGEYPVTSMLAERRVDIDIDGLSALSQYARLHGEIVALFAEAAATDAQSGQVCMSPATAARLLGPISEARDILAALARICQDRLEGCE